MSSGGAQPTRSRVSLQPLGKEHKKKRRQVEKMLQESPLAQSASFPALPGVTPTKNGGGGRGDKLEVPNLFAKPPQVRGGAIVSVALRLRGRFTVSIARRSWCNARGAKR